MSPQRAQRARSGKQGSLPAASGHTAPEPLSKARARCRPLLCALRGLCGSCKGRQFVGQTCLVRGLVKDQNRVGSRPVGRRWMVRPLLVHSRRYGTCISSRIAASCFWRVAISWLPTLALGWTVRVPRPSDRTGGHRGDAHFRCGNLGQLGWHHPGRCGIIGLVRPCPNGRITIKRSRTCR